MIITKVLLTGFAGASLCMANISGIVVTNFSALPGGYRNIEQFYDLKVDGYWWSASEYNEGYAYKRCLGYC